ncbi:T-cell surface glycoprotein CD4 [Paralichthys olivaceus]|uniref:T-cell surface glycoprotein CD4 n=1 Tax=Paralichthys olivaceus TaxID=8255 RepID=UPI00097DE289|nr:PREDICTED: T-cell surface glycoprotein CD4-like [Paralichthys olivaceus]
MEKFVLILFAALVSTSGASEVVYAQVGEKVTLKPQVEIKSYKYVYWSFGKQDGPQLAWLNHLGGQFLTNATSWNKLAISDVSLVIKQIQPENFGEYFCKITSKDPILDIKPITLIEIKVSLNPVGPLLPGQSLTLSCDVESSEKPEIYWMNPRGEIMNDTKGTVDVRITNQHHGKWTCVVAKKKQVKIDVTVIDLSPAPSLPQYTSTSSPITIPCSIPTQISWLQIKAKGVQEVHWQFFPETSSGLDSDGAQRLFSLSLKDTLSWTREQDRELSPAQDPKTGNLDLTRKLGRVEDGGDYVCTMKFENGVTLNRTIHVQVLQIISSPGENILSGQQLNLTCSVGRPLPSDLHLQWSPPKKTSLPSLKSQLHPTHLTVPEVSTDNGGNWSCTLYQEEKQLTSAVITLTIETKLNVWMLVIACIASVIVILLLLILALILHRRRRKRYLRHQLCRCKNPKPKGFYRT